MADYQEYNRIQRMKRHVRSALKEMHGAPHSMVTATISTPQTSLQACLERAVLTELMRCMRPRAAVRGPCGLSWLPREGVATSPPSSSVRLSICEQTTQVLGHQGIGSSVRLSICKQTTQNFRH